MAELKDTLNAFFAKASNNNVLIIDEAYALSRPEIEEAGNNSTCSWYNASNQLHRLDGPAVEWSDGSKFWYCKGKRHRLDGPAVEMANGKNQWWIDGTQYDEDAFAARIRALEAPARRKKELALHRSRLERLERHVSGHKRRS